MLDVSYFCTSHRGWHPHGVLMHTSLSLSLCFWIMLSPKTKWCISSDLLYLSIRCTRLSQEENKRLLFPLTITVDQFSLFFLCPFFLVPWQPSGDSVWIAVSLHGYFTMKIWADSINQLRIDDLLKCHVDWLYERSLFLFVYFMFKGCVFCSAGRCMNFISLRSIRLDILSWVILIQRHSVYFAFFQDKNDALNLRNAFSLTD